MKDSSKEARLNKLENQLSGWLLAQLTIITTSVIIFNIALWNDLDWTYPVVVLVTIISGVGLFTTERKKRQLLNEINEL